MADSNLGPRWRHLARVLRGEQATTKAARAALEALLDYAARVLRSSGYDAGVLDAKSAGWAKIAAATVLPQIEEVFLASFNAAGQGIIDPAPYATRHLEAVTNRLAGVPDDVFDTMRLALEEGRSAGEGIPQLAQRVDALLSDTERWANRAVTIARTEVIGAANAGAVGSAYASADLLGEDPANVVKEWLATGDSRTRETHAEADGQQVLGLDATFDVGGSSLDQPGDPAGDPGEVINCRCTVLFYYPGDPNYPTELSSGQGSQYADTEVDLETAAAPSPEAVAAAEEQADEVAAQSPEDRMRDRIAASTPRPNRTPAAAVVNDIPAKVAPSTKPTPVTEHPTDPGPSTDQERMARSLTLDELVMELKRGSSGAKSAARAELRRRGFPGVASGRIKAALRASGQETTMAENEETQTGVVIVALPRADDPVQGIGPEQKHSTILYFGDVPVDGADNPNDLLDDSARAIMVSVLEVAAAEYAPFTETVTDVESLGDDGARVWMLDGTNLPDLRNDLLDVDTELATVLAGVEQYPSYTPHVTIGYPEPAADQQTPTALDPAVEEAAAAVESITFDRLALWWAGEQIEYPLNGTADPRGAAPEEPPVTEPTDPVQAALTTLQQAGWALHPPTYAEGDTLPGPEGSPAPTPEDEVPAAASDISTDGPPLYGILWPEGVQSGDARAIEVGATTWRDLPLPLMAQEATAMGHDGAVRVARIDTIDRDEATYSVPVIRYTGTWDTSPAAAETMRQVQAGILRGLSVDGDAVTVELRGSDGAPLDPMVDDFPEDGVVVEVATAARVAGATGCSVPAFQQAYVSNGTLADRAAPEPGWNEDGTPKDNVIGQPPEGETEVGDQPQTEPAVAASGLIDLRQSFARTRISNIRGTEPSRMAPAWSLVASAGPVWSASDFANPGLTEPTRLTVTDDGRVFGHLATWGVCHIGIDGICQEPPISATNYAYFATGQVPTDQGWASVGQLTMETGHAGMQLGAKAAVSHYDNTGTGVADVAMGQDAVGIWFAGRLRPGTTPEQVYAMRAVGSVSGDWREVGGNLELVAGLICNVPGFPIPAPSIAASGDRPVAMVASGVVHPSEEAVRRGSDLLLTMSDVHAAVETVLANRARYARATTAASRLRTHRATMAQRRLDAFASYQRKTRATAAAARLTKRG